MYHRRTVTRKHGLNPIERAVLVAKWRTDKVSAGIHALIGGDGLRLVNEAGRVMYVVLGAAAAQGLSHDDPDLRILRGAVNALHEQAEVADVDEQRRSSIVSGLQACDRLLSELTQRALSDAALELEIRLKLGDVRYSDFQRLAGAAA